MLKILFYKAQLFVYEYKADAKTNFGLK